MTSNRQDYPVSPGEAAAAGSSSSRDEPGPETRADEAATTPTSQNEGRKA
jgi:hypothetical protein